MRVVRKHGVHTQYIPMIHLFNTKTKIKEYKTTIS